MREMDLYGSRLAVRKTLIPIIKVSVRRNSRSWVLNDAYKYPNGLYGSRLAVRKTLIPIIKVSVRRNSRSWVLNDAYNHSKMPIV